MRRLLHRQAVDRHLDQRHQMRLPRAPLARRHWIRRNCRSRSCCLTPAAHAGSPKRPPAQFPPCAALPETPAGWRAVSCDDGRPPYHRALRASFGCRDNEQSHSPSSWASRLRLQAGNSSATRANAASVQAPAAISRSRCATLPVCARIGMRRQACGDDLREERGPKRRRTPELVVQPIKRFARRRRRCHA